ncbi:MAG: hypothetical protein PVF16_02610 [Chromatiales bacterium]|jgi:hypothetical protein
MDNPFHQKFHAGTLATPGTVALLLASLAVPALAGDFTARSGGPSSEEMLARNAPGAVEGTSFFRPVMSGVLYRGGFKGGDKARTGLSSSQRESLCEKGFSRAFYADFGKHTDYGTTFCGAGRILDYESARSSSPAPFIKAVHSVIENPDKGPVFVHCMWGVHSSGALSAMALVQFCGWSEARAKQYWNEARNNAPCGGGCDSWIDAKFKHFKFDPALEITDAQRAAICPK